MWSRGRGDECGGEGEMNVEGKGEMSVEGKGR